jgi:hypothetical protein
MRFAMITDGGIQPRHGSDSWIFVSMYVRYGEDGCVPTSARLVSGKVEYALLEPLG